MGVPVWNIFCLLLYSTHRKRKLVKCWVFFLTFIDVIHELSLLFNMRSSVFHKFFFYGKQGLYKYTIILYYYSLTLSSKFVVSLSQFFDCDIPSCYCKMIQFIDFIWYTMTTSACKTWVNYNNSKPIKQNQVKWTIKNHYYQNRISFTVTNNINKCGLRDRLIDHLYQQKPWGFKISP